ncbi:MAG TPA: hypothetical protein VIW03_04245 [Anaeromyxobacter sp.]
MRRVRLAWLAAAAAALSGCGSKGSASQGPRLSHPSAIAIFYGVTVEDRANVRPYLAIANEARNDLTLADANTDAVLNAPVLLRPLAIPFPDRPTLLASARLGDDTPDAPKPSLLVGVPAGSSKLQLVSTWTPDNGIVAELDLGDDVLAIAAIPSAAGTARLAVALAGQRLAVVRYARQLDGGVALDATYGPGGFVVHGLGFEAAALATVGAYGGAPADTAHVYAATLDPIGPGAVLGVAEVDVSAPAEPWPARALNARAPTRLVAAAQLRERLDGSVDGGAAAFAGQPVVTRVYAALDEGSCGPQRSIDCGIVTLDPAKTPAAGDDHIPEDWAGWMPYRAPLQIRSRPLLLAAVSPPAKAPPVDASFGFVDGGDTMRLEANGTQVTTGVGVVVGENGTLEFLDLGRFKVASTSSAPVAAVAIVVEPRETNRIWLQRPGTNQFAATDEGPGFIHLTPGYATDESWTVAYQGPLPGLQGRAVEVGAQGTNQVWLAVQSGDGTPGATGRRLTQVARLVHPALGVKVGDIVIFKAASVGCTGAPPPGTPVDQIETVPKEFETRIVAILPPSDATPGGAAVLESRTTGPEEPPTPVNWAQCFDALSNLVKAAPVRLPGTVTFAASDLVLTGNVLGYAGRPQLGVEYKLRYRADPSEPGLPSFAYLDEDALATACPLVDWDGIPPAPTCGGGACDPAACEQLVLARKVRRRYHLAEDCGNPPDASCLVRYPSPGFTFPKVNGPALDFQVGHQLLPGFLTSTLIRGFGLRFSTTSGVAVLSASPGGAVAQANGVTTFDRSFADATAGYRFVVSYPGNQVADASPDVTPISSVVIR